jgi:hypothetical protein
MPRKEAMSPDYLVYWLYICKYTMIRVEDVRTKLTILYNEHIMISILQSAKKKPEELGDGPGSALSVCD